MKVEDDRLKEILDYWPMIGGAVAFIAGYADLKADHKSLRRDVEANANRYDRERAEDNARTYDMIREMRGDIKTLLMRGSK